MKIEEEYIEEENPVLNVQEACYLNNYKIRVKFSDGNERIVDFEQFLRKSTHPSIKKYLQNDMFNKFKIISGNLNWNDYDMIFPIWDLYQGSIK